MTHRRKKQIIIGSIYLVLFALLFFGGYLIFHHRPTCYDGIQNQGEEGIDCGGPCSPCLPKVSQPVISEQQLIREGNGLYEFVARIKNQSQVYGNPEIDYQIKLYGVTGKVVKIISSTTFLLPGEEKYIVKPAIRVDSKIKIVKGKIEITHLSQWSKLSEGVWPDLVVENKEIRIIGRPDQYALVKGVILNRSNVGYRKILVDVILIGQEEGKRKVVRINRSEMRDLIPHQEREFSVFWTKPFVNQKFNLIIQAETNPFDPDNIIIGSKVE